MVQPLPKRDPTPQMKSSIPAPSYDGFTAKSRQVISRQRHLNPCHLILQDAVTFCISKT
ncbi:hypothetical protein TSMEX_002098 [Taenia solium]|eukprot:TsM_000583800 transcript=TsM_000583800 gene=TsM_000583800